MVDELVRLRYGSGCHEKDMRDQLTEIEQSYDDWGEGLQRTVRSLVEDVLSLVVQKRDEDSSLPGQFEELRDELFEKLRAEGEEHSATVGLPVAISATIDSSKHANSVRCLKYEAKRMKSITDTELREQFAPVTALAKDRT
jgi:hypothetical protein